MFFSAVPQDDATKKRKLDIANQNAMSNKKGGFYNKKGGNNNGGGKSSGSFAGKKR